MTPFEMSKRRLQLKGITLTRLPGEFQVAWGSKTFVSPELDEVVAEGERMAAELAARQAATGPRRKRPSIWSKRPKYARMAQIRAFNRRRLKARWAGRGKMSG